MSVRAKVFTIILVLFGFLGVTDFLVQRFVVYPSFLALEHQEAGQNLQRIFQAIDRESYHLERISRDWATWDDSHDFMTTGSEAYVKSNLNDEAMDSIAINVMIFFTTDGAIVWGNARDTAQENPVDLELLQSGSIGQDHPLISLPPGENGVRGVISTEHGPLLFASRQILRSDGSGPVAGLLTVGRILSPAMVEGLAEQTRIPFEIIYPYAESKMLCGKSGIKAASTGSLQYFTQDEGDHVKVCSAYPGPTGTPIFGIQYLFPREITQKGLASIRYAMILVISSGLIVLVILNALLQAVILRPLQKLTEHAVRMQREEDYSLRLDLRRSDEVGVLAGSFDSMVQTIRERTEELKRANEQLTLLSMRDGLTGIPNRRMFDASLKQEWRRAMRSGTPISLVLGDVDFFKNYNDAHGHPQGDQCLIAVAAVLQRQIQRPADLAARFGGEEFAVILADTDSQGAEHVAQSLRQAILDLRLDHGQSEASAFVTMSFGVVSVIPLPEDGDEGMIGLLKKADQALYQAKRSGRDRVVVWSGEQPDSPTP